MPFNVIWIVEVFVAFVIALALHESAHAAMAARVALAAEVDRLILFHHDPNYPDADVLALEHAARQLFPRTWAAREGGEIWLDGQDGRHV